MLVMQTFAIKTLGCKVNQYESQQIRELLERLGLKPVSADAQPDLVVVNTCCVTHVASAKSRRQVRKSRQVRPDTVVVIAGCLPAVAADTLKAMPGRLHIVRDKRDLPEVLHSLIRAPQDASRYANRPVPIATISNRAEKHTEIKEKRTLASAQDLWGLAPIRRFSGQSRAFLKVQDGCDASCTYCIIPRIRTKVCNKPVNTVVAEAEQLVAAGHREIVLTGIFLGAYGQDTVRRRRWEPGRSRAFSDLVDRVAQVPGLRRLRLSSLAPGDVTDPLLDTMSKHENIMPHLHLPLQSGSDAILRKMARPYRVDEYLRTIDHVRTVLDRPAITTDVIVGFPHESDRDFEQSLDLARRVGFSKVHVFAFSPRKGTPAADFRPRVPTSTIRERSRVFRELDALLQGAFRRQFIGGQVSAILESNDPPAGRTERYFMVSADNLDNATIEADCILTGTLRT